MLNRVMKSSLVLSALAPFALSFCLSSAASAAEGSTVFWVDHDILKWTSRTDEPDQGSDTDHNALQTTPNDVTIGIFWKDYGIYVTPGDAGGLVSGSYYFTKQIEAGLQLGFDNSKDENKAGAATTTVERKETSVGIFGTYYLPVNTDGTAEFTLNYLNSREKTETETSSGNVSTTVTNSDSKANGFGILAQYAYQVAPHFNYVPGISYGNSSIKNDTASTKDKSNVLTLNIVHFRYVF
ncbi:MAG: hypothetical protein EOP07_11240 [Proteobacteria bacterium]|nr:MAG: hypothetical protein EOP07_11240 [Pseudomonadota bacterium]